MRCSESAVGWRVEAREKAPGFFRWGDLTLFGRNVSGDVRATADDALVDVGNRIRVEGGNVVLPFDPDEVLENLRNERYIDERESNAGTGSPVRRAYYAVRPLLPVAVRKYLQRLALRSWDRIPFPAWPVDTTVDDLVERLWLVHFEARGPEPVPFVWFWPEGHRSCCILTHDVETASGLDLCPTLMEMEAGHELVSSFELIPEERYEVTEDHLERIRNGGCEICVHGLNHDGSLFRSEAEFRARAEKINEYAARFGAVGFRSPVMYRNLEWFDAFRLDYDMSVPSVAHLDPQRGGCCTVMPYFIGDLVELPLTTTQDYSLFHILGDHSLDLWREQIRRVSRRHGLISFIVHPDYLVDRKTRMVYGQLLAHLEDTMEQERMWHALPRDVAAWWRQRSAMRVVESGGSWKVDGPGSERARVAWARPGGDGVIYEVDDAATGRAAQLQ